jgi:transposase-like protein
MTQKKDTSIIKEFQKVLLDDKDFLKNMLERLNQELKHISRAIRIFPNEVSCTRLLGTLCMEQSEEWKTGRRYLKMQEDPNQD